MKNKNTYAPLVAIVGRANVGKSTLFNRLVGKRLALVHPTPGVTRDQREEIINIGGIRVRLLDTAGYEGDSDPELAEQIDFQTRDVIAKADLCLFVIDAKVGLIPHDYEFASTVRKLREKTIVLANKCESGSLIDVVAECNSFGLGDVLPVSAEHGMGINELHHSMENWLQEISVDSNESENHENEDEGDEEDDLHPYRDNSPLRVVILGRPNRGKSTLMNRLIGENKMVVGASPGVTRDVISHDISWKDKKIKLFDTAGIRRRRSVNSRLEKLMVSQALRGVRFAEVVILLIESTSLPEKQELTLARHIVDEGRALIIGLSKADIAQREIVKKVRYMFADTLAQIGNVPIVLFSAKHDNGLDSLLSEVVKVDESWNTRIGTGKLNRWLEDAVNRHPPATVNGRRPNLKFMTQSKSRPPTFVIFCQRPEAIEDSYKRYLASKLRAEFGFGGVPIRLIIRARENPYIKK